MKNTRIMLCIVVGLLAGASGVSATRSAQSKQGSSGRLQSIPAAGLEPGYTAFFIKDTTSQACWFAIRPVAPNSIALAVAPQEACK